MNPDLFREKCSRKRQKMTFPERKSLIMHNRARYLYVSGHGLFPRFAWIINPRITYITAYNFVAHAIRNSSAVSAKFPAIFLRPPRRQIFEQSAREPRTSGMFTNRYIESRIVHRLDALETILIRK